jgi:hypothetical protein
MTKEESWQQSLMLYEATEKDHPDFWNRLYPRRYNDVGSYDSPKAVGRALIDAISAYVQSKGGVNEQAEVLWASLMVRYRVPTYYLSRDLAEALLKTTPVERIDWTDMKLPMPCAAFMLPRDMLLHPGEEGYISFVAYSRTMENQREPVPYPVPSALELHCMKTNFNIFARVHNGCTLHWTLDENYQLIDFKQVGEDLEAGPWHDTKLKETQLDGSDNAVLARCVNLLFNILLLMTAKSEMVECGQILKRVRFGKSGFVEYWSPHIIGRSYKIRREVQPGDGSHASPRGHWVSGFWREQPHGPGRTLRRTLWIEPFFRGGAL